jgi:hypothetical protein
VLIVRGLEVLAKLVRGEEKLRLETKLGAVVARLGWPTL